MLLVGGNGSGKSSVARILECLQWIGRGETQLKELFKVTDCAWLRRQVPIVIEIEGALEGKFYHYRLSVEFPENFRNFRVAEERLSIDGTDVFSRTLGQVVQPRQSGDVQFTHDWHHVALPTLTPRLETDPGRKFLNWLSNFVILAPVPEQMTGESTLPELAPLRSGSNVGDWFSALTSRWGKAWSIIQAFLTEINPSLSELENTPVGGRSSQLQFQFQDDSRRIRLPFSSLSDGEKCLFLGAVLLASMQTYGPILCFWDEPDNHLTLGEVGNFIMALRRAAKLCEGNQVILTSHHPETMRHFSDENILFFKRASSLEPTRVRSVAEYRETDKDLDLVQAMALDQLA